ncbi:MAG: adenosine kinase [Rhodospirillaceae bacterium]|nr:adenosine kinase [Rhodospirillaceae bacterium]|tara:strand:+ start:6791 stop:7783 length:993 start_codon:yes stop_codon:yes gene_type:complete
MTNARYDVIGVGNAIVDVISAAPETLLQELGLDKGVMTLIDAERGEELYSAMGSKVETSGGSAANTLAGIASLGGNGAYIGKVRDDVLGKVFHDDLMKTGVDYRTPLGQDGPPTARCLIFVTSDAERTMQTCLGISVQLGPEDIEKEAIEAAEITYLEGYLFDPPEAKKAFVKAAEISHAAGRKVALSLSDAFCVERHRAEFMHLISGHVDILFANEGEITSLFEVSDFAEAVNLTAGHCEVAALTQGEKGCVVVKEGATHEVDAQPVENVVDTTGAGDLFAAGFLFGYTRGLELQNCGAIGTLAAAEIISHYGARPETSLADLLAESNL